MRQRSILIHTDKKTTLLVCNEHSNHVDLAYKATAHKLANYAGHLGIGDEVLHLGLRVKSCEDVERR